MTNIADNILHDQSVVPAAAVTVTLSTSSSSNSLDLDCLVDGLKGAVPHETCLETNGSASGKREASGPLVTTSDEEEILTPPTSPRVPCTTVSSLHDHDYENISSPGSTSSETIVIRPPGFLHRAVSIPKPKVKKKKTHSPLIPIQDALVKPSNKELLTAAKSQVKRDTLPMRMRALPQSFWQQPNNAHNSSPAQNYSILPPLVSKDGDEVSDIRPVSPIMEEPDRSIKFKLEKTSKVSERKLTIANTDLLFKLFEDVDKDTITKGPTIRHHAAISTKNVSSQSKIENASRNTTSSSLRRAKPRKLNITQVAPRNVIFGEDPYLVDCVTDKIFPQLNFEHSKLNNTTCVQFVSIREGDKSVCLPSLNLEQNYPQMLSELVMHI